ncbi:MAG TPA: STAS domain-containing protein [Pseudonocardiaceae bacterium]|nr:STAS domain-containing protein [Pseudonocardiaceae bacterium]
MVARRCGGVGDTVTPISPGWAPEEFLSVTALSCSAQGVVVRVVGEVDLATLGWLREHLHNYVSSDYRGVVLDCTEVSFLAACGTSLLVETAERARAEGMALRLVTQTPLVLRALQTALADQLIPRAATVAEVVAQCAA